MIMTGDVRTFADALDKPIQDPAVVAAMTTAGFPATRSDFDLGSLQRTYYSTDDGAVDFLFEDGALTSVIVATQATDKHGAYPRPGALFDQLPADAERAAVRALLGEPEWTSEDPTEEADQFAVDGFFQHFIFVDGRIARVTLMRDDPADW